MRYRNIFNPIKKNKPIEYSDLIKSAVLDPKIQGLVLNFNGGFDWIDSKYGFIKLLLQRGQIKAIKSGSDLLARQDYLEALWSSRSHVNVVLEDRTIGESATGLCISPKGCSYASPKRIQQAQDRLYSFALKVMSNG